MRSTSSARAVNIRIGMWRVAGSVFKILQTSSPGIFANIKSRMMKSGFSSRTFASPAAPSVAVETTNPPALRRFNVRRSTTSFSSSTMRIRLLDTASITRETLQVGLLCFARDLGFYAGLFVPGLGVLVQTDHDLERFVIDRVGLLIHIVRPDQS